MGTSTNISSLAGSNTTSDSKDVNMVYFMYGGYVVIIIVLGLVQNTMTVYVFVRDKRLRLFHNYYIVGLATADVGMCLTGNWMIAVAAFHGRWVFGRHGCVYYGFITTLFGITQISLLTSIAFDRYVVIVKPCGFQITKQRALIIVILCYISGCLWASFPALGWNSYQLEGLRIRCAIDWQSQRPTDLSFTMTAVVCVWVLPLVVVVVSYGGIYIKLNRDKATARLRNFHNLRRHKREHKIAITVLLMIGAFFVSWTPYSILTLIAAFSDTAGLPRSAAVFPALVAKTSIIWNPVIYVARHKLFRKAILDRIKCLRSQKS